MYYIPLLLSLKQLLSALFLMRQAEYDLHMNAPFLMNIDIDKSQLLSLLHMAVLSMFKSVLLNLSIIPSDCGLYEVVLINRKQISFISVALKLEP